MRVGETNGDREYLMQVLRAATARVKLISNTLDTIGIALRQRAILDERLSPSERAILLDRYGENPTNLDELGRQFGLSDETIRQKEAKALAKVRAAANGGKD